MGYLANKINRKLNPVRRAKQIARQKIQYQYNPVHQTKQKVVNKMGLNGVQNARNKVRNYRNKIRNAKNLMKNPL